MIEAIRNILRYSKAIVLLSAVASLVSGACNSRATALEVPAPSPAPIARPYRKSAGGHSRAGFALRASTRDAGCRAAIHPLPSPYTPVRSIPGKYAGRIRWNPQFRSSDLASLLRQSKVNPCSQLRSPILFFPPPSEENTSEYSVEVCINDRPWSLFSANLAAKSSRAIAFTLRIYILASLWSRDASH
jgi:hypothetical protein